MWKADKHSVHCVCCSGEGTQLATAGRSIKLWNLEDHTLLKARPCLRRSVGLDVPSLLRSRPLPTHFLFPWQPQPRPFPVSMATTGIGSLCSLADLSVCVCGEVCSQICDDGCVGLVHLSLHSLLLSLIAKLSCCSSHSLPFTEVHGPRHSSKNAVLRQPIPVLVVCSE